MTFTSALNFYGYDSAQKLQHKVETDTRLLETLLPL